MPRIRFFAVFLASILAFLSPGSQAWAALAKAAVPAAASRDVPSGKVGSTPVPGFGSGSVGGLSGTLSLAPTVALPGAVVLLPPGTVGLSGRPEVPGAAVLLSPGIEGLSQPHAALPVAAEPVPAITVEIPAQGSPAETSGRSAPAKLNGLASEAAPHLQTALDPDASPTSVAQSGADLQAVLEGVSSRRSSASGLLPWAAPAEDPTLLGSAPSGLGPTSGLAPASGATAASAEKPSTAVLPVPSAGGESGRSEKPADDLTKEQKSRFRFYSGAVAGVKVGIEALNLAVPLLLLTQLQAATAVATLYLAAEVASIFAGLMGGALVDLIGAKRAMVLTGFGQALAIAGVPLAIASGGAMALPMVYGLFMFNGVASELFDVARRSALPQIVGQDEGVLRKSNGGVYVWREIAATAGVFGAGWLVHSIGAMTTIWVHPAFCVAAALAALRLLRSGQKSHPSRASPNVKPAAGPMGLKAKFQAWLKDLKQGVRYVVSDKKLRTVVLINIPLNALHKIFHTLMAVVFAAKILNDPGDAAFLLGAWNIGELVGALYLQRWGKTSRLANWMRLAGAASLAVWSFYLLPFAWAGIAASFILAAAMIGNELGTASYMQSTVPEKEIGAVTGFVYGFARAVGMLALLASGWAFDRLGASGGFMVMAVIFTVMAPVYLLASFKFKSDKLDAPADMPQD